MTLPPTDFVAALADTYRVERELGSGGMAVVYLAHDLRHHRKVALKVMRPELTDSVNGERFLAEIRTTANLQHPHILGLIDSGQANGHVYYVMPLVQGESVRARLQRERQLPVDEAVRITREVALALDFAHRQGVIHRDIKPENILLQDGQAMVADFGVALALTESGTSRLTQSGLSIGTPPYMSPEQAMGDRQLTARSDIYALGCVLYEMLAGEPPHAGPTAQAVVGKVLSAEPASISGLRPSVPRHVATAVHVALRKVAADRFVSAQAFAEALGPQSTLAEQDSSAGRISSTQWTGWKGWVAAAGLVAAGIATGWVAKPQSSTASEGRPPLSLAYVLPSGLRLPALIPGLALSPDGTTLVYSTASATDGGATADQPLYLQRLDEAVGRPLAGTAGGVWPFFSPDGLSVGFNDQEGLKVYSLSDGSVRKLADRVAIPYGGDATWGDDGSIVFGANGPGITEGIRRIAAAGGPILTLSRLDSSLTERHYAPQLLPGAKTVIYTVRTTATGRYPERVVAMRISGADSGVVRTLIDGATLARYVGNGRLMYQIGNEVFSSAFDVQSLVVSERTRVIDNAVRVTSGRWWAIAGDIMVYRPAAPDKAVVTWVDRNGRREPLPVPRDNYLLGPLSPDGNRFALTIRQGLFTSDVAVYDIRRDVLTRVTSDGVSESPIWQPDGTRLITAHRAGGTAMELHSTPADGSSGQHKVFGRGTQVWPASFSKDGRNLVVMQIETDNGDLWMLDIAGDLTLRPLVKTPAPEFGGRLSPDERWVSYFALVAGRFELFVTPYPGGGSRWQVSREGAREAAWSRDGRELFFRNGRQLLVSDVRPGPTFSTGTPRVLFEGDFRQTGGPGGVQYDVSLDGKRFLMLEEPVAGPPRFQVIQGVDQFLKRAEATNPR